MVSNRKTALIAGLFFIGTFVFSIPAVLLSDPVLNDADYILGPGSDTCISLGAFLEILTRASAITARQLVPKLPRRPVPACQRRSAGR